MEVKSQKQQKSILFKSKSVKQKVDCFLKHRVFLLFLTRPMRFLKKIINKCIKMKKRVSIIMQR